MSPRGSQKLKAVRPGNRSLATASSASGSDAPIELWSVMAQFTSSNCSDAPREVISFNNQCNSPLINSLCYFGGFDEDDKGKVPYAYYEDACTASLQDYVEDKFAGMPYVRFDYFDDVNCSEFRVTTVWLADGKCHTGYYPRSYYNTVVSTLVGVEADGSIKYEEYQSDNCSGDPLVRVASREQLTTGECLGAVTAQTNVDLPQAAESEENAAQMSSATEFGIILGAIGFGFVAIVLVMWRRGSKQAIVSTQGYSSASPSQVAGVYRQ